MAQIEKKGSFEQMYGEAVEALRMFQGYSSDMLQSCLDDDHSAVKVNFELADEFYKKAGSIARHLSLWHGGRVIGRLMTAWTQEERGQEALIRSLDGMASSGMNHLLTAYRVWLAKAQFVTRD